MEATILLANKIALGQIETGIACGTDTTPDMRITGNRNVQRGLLRVNAAKTNCKKASLVHGLSPCGHTTFKAAQCAAFVASVTADPSRELWRGLKRCVERC